MQTKAVGKTRSLKLFCLGVGWLLFVNWVIVG